MRWQQQQQQQQQQQMDERVGVVAAGDQVAQRESYLLHSTAAMTSSTSAL
jgi:hypothetical protein